LTATVTFLTNSYIWSTFSGRNWKIWISCWSWWSWSSLSLSGLSRSSLYWSSLRNTSVTFTKFTLTTISTVFISITTVTILTATVTFLTNSNIWSTFFGRDWKIWISCWSWWSWSSLSWSSLSLSGLSRSSLSWFIIILWLTFIFWFVITKASIWRTWNRETIDWSNIFTSFNNPLLNSIWIFSRGRTSKFSFEIRFSVWLNFNFMVTTVCVQSL